MVGISAQRVACNSRVLADWLADCASRAWSGRLGQDGRLFGAWLVDRPDVLQAVQQNERLPPLFCFAA